MVAPIQNIIAATVAQSLLYYWISFFRVPVTILDVKDKKDWISIDYLKTVTILPGDSRGPHLPEGVLEPLQRDLQLLDNSATVNPASPTNIGYSAFLSPISEEGDQPTCTLRASPSPLLEYFLRPRDMPFKLSPYSPESYPSGGLGIHIRASRYVYWSYKKVLCIFRHISVDLGV